jgi:hypothetical protein
MNAHDSLPKTVPWKTADRAGELVFNVLWSYVKDMEDQENYNNPQILIDRPMHREDDRPAFRSWCGCSALDIAKDP